MLAATLCSGCTPLGEYVHNGFKVGPNYRTPPASVEPAWIDAADRRLRSDSDDLSRWWAVFNDPVLDSLVCHAYQQNLTLREAGFRVMQARAQLGIALGNLLPQSQNASGSYTRYGLSQETANNILNFNLPGVNRFYDQWTYGLNLSWELDFWGRFRRAVESNAASLNASVNEYDDVLVTLLGDVAMNYVQLRTLEQRIAYAQSNIDLQRETLQIVEARFRANTISAVDLHQGRSTLAQTEAAIAELQIGARQAANRLCVLLGMPPEDLRARLEPRPIPVAPPEVAIGIPAALLSRRPDVRRAERQAAAQSAQIGVAESDFYPHIAIGGTIGYASENFSQLFGPQALYGAVGPQFQWNLLNYNRIRNNVRVQDAKFRELVTAYQQTVLLAAQEVENGLVQFLRAQQRSQFQGKSVDEALQAVKLVLIQYQAGTVDFTRVTQLELNLVTQQDILAQARGEIASGLTQVYRALGGGWEIRIQGCTAPPLPPAGQLPIETVAPPEPMTTPGAQSPPSSALPGAEQFRPVE
jgi:NodT family efflux transporter outer membrane factor (OMF) lipoprotein